MRQTLLRVLEREIGGFTEDALYAPLHELGIDSFGMLSLRAALEQAAGAAYSDDAWTSAATLGDLVAPAAAGEAANPAVRLAQARQYTIGMPQMAFCALSERWLFAETGDFHWSLISRGLGAPAAEILDGDGHRLYATFSRFRLAASAPLSAFRENDALVLDGEISRFGAGFFFGDYRWTGPNGAIRIELMSNFARRAKTASNIGLMRGQPNLPPGCAIRELTEMPPIGRAYRQMRAGGPPGGDVLHSCAYEIAPYQDINGVGLLYFATFASIADICEGRMFGKEAMAYRTVSRDVAYFANCDPDDSLIYRVHGSEQSAERVRRTSSLSRVSDGALLAILETAKVRA